MPLKQVIANAEVGLSKAERTALRKETEELMAKSNVRVAQLESTTDEFDPNAPIEAQMDEFDPNAPIEIETPSEVDPVLDEELETEIEAQSAPPDGGISEFVEEQSVPPEPMTQDEMGIPPVVARTVEAYGHLQIQPHPKGVRVYNPKNNRMVMVVALNKATRQDPAKLRKAAIQILRSIGNHGLKRTASMWKAKLVVADSIVDYGETNNADLPHTGDAARDQSTNDRGESAMANESFDGLDVTTAVGEGPLQDHAQVGPTRTVPGLGGPVRARQAQLGNWGSLSANESDLVGRYAAQNGCASIGDCLKDENALSQYLASSGLNPRSVINKLKAMDPNDTQPFTAQRMAQVSPDGGPLQNRLTNLADENNDRVPNDGSGSSSNSLSVTELSDSDKQENYDDFNISDDALDGEMNTFKNETIARKAQNMPPGLQQPGVVESQTTQPSAPAAPLPVAPPEQPLVASESTEEEFDINASEEVEERLARLYQARAKRVADRKVTEFIHRFTRCIRLACRRQALNLEPNQLKIAMADVLMVPNQVGYQKIAALDPSSAIHLIEAGLNVEQQLAFVDSLIQRTAQLLSSSDETIAQLEDDLDQIQPVAPQTEEVFAPEAQSEFEEEEMPFEEPVASRQAALGGNPVLTSVSERSQAEAPGDKRMSIRASLRGTKGSVIHGLFTGR